MSRGHQGPLVADLGSDRISLARHGEVTDPVDLFVVWDKISEYPAFVDAELLAENLHAAEHIGEELDSSWWKNRQTSFHSGSAVDNLA